MILSDFDLWRVFLKVKKHGEIKLIQTYIKNQDPS